MVHAFYCMHKNVKPFFKQLSLYNYIKENRHPSIRHTNLAVSRAWSIDVTSKTETSLLSIQIHFRCKFETLNLSQLVTQPQTQASLPAFRRLQYTVLQMMESWKGRKPGLEVISNLYIARTLMLLSIEAQLCTRRECKTFQPVLCFNAL